MKRGRGGGGIVMGIVLCGKGYRRGKRGGGEEEGGIVIRIL